MYRICRWTDRAHGPVADDADSFLSAFPPCNELHFDGDGTVRCNPNITPNITTDFVDCVMDVAGDYLRERVADGARVV